MFLYNIIFSVLVLCFLENVSTLLAGASTQDFKIPSLQHSGIRSKFRVEDRTQDSPIHNVLQRRATSPYQNCNSWSNWINRNNPNNTSKNDRESINETDIHNFCPVGKGIDASKISCKDDKGEPFSGTITDKVGRFTVNCTDIKVGVSCGVFDKNSSDTCPDFSIRFYCNCSSFDRSTQAASLSIQGRTIAKLTPQSKATSTTNQPTVTSNVTKDYNTHNPAWKPSDVTPSALTSTINSSSNAPATALQTGEQEEKSGFFENKTVWLSSFIICVALFLSNCTFMVFLHRRSINYAKKGREQTKVEPY